MKKIILFTLIGLFIASNAFATVYYVRAGATGDDTGLNWDDAYTQLPEDLERGATYYIADGEYSSYTFDDEEDGEKYIIIKKAIESDHGASDGWNSSYGDGQAVFVSLTIETGYYRLDGQRGNGKDALSYGFSILPHNCTSPDPVIDIYFPSELSMGDIEIKYFNLEGCGEEYNDTKQVAIKARTSAHSNFNISHNYIHEHCVAISIDALSDSVIEHNYIQNGWAKQGVCNCDAVATHFSPGPNILRYNTVDAFPKDGGTGVFIFGKSPPTGNGDKFWEIYGNVVFNSIASNGVFASDGDGELSDSVIYNNTIVNCGGSNAGVTYGLGSNNTLFNNIWYNNKSNTIALGDNHDYNWFYDNWRTDRPEPEWILLDPDLMASEDNAQLGTEDLFIDWQGGDFRLKEATLPGIVFDWMDDIDPDGNTRGEDGVWDRGAFEFTPVYYVTSSGAGAKDGSDWANAFDQDALVEDIGEYGHGPGEIGPGDTVYIAGGEYPITIEIPDCPAGGDCTDVLTLKKATATNHGTETGWSPEWGTQQAVFEGLLMRKWDYITIDGQEEYGIKFVSDVDSYVVNLTRGNKNPSNHIILRYLEIEGPGMNQDHMQSAGLNIYHAANSIDILVEYCKIHEFSCVGMKGGAEDFIFQYNDVYNIADTSCHEDFMLIYSGNGSVRYNTFYNQGSGGGGVAIYAHDNLHNDQTGPYFVHSNLIYQTGDFKYGQDSKGISVQGSSIADAEIYAYNNTIVDFESPFAIGDGNGYTTTGDVKNNLVYATELANAAFTGDISHSYNWYSADVNHDYEEGEITSPENPFAGYAGQDFALSAGIAGAILDSEYGMDMFGTPRGEDGVWDRGAYEFDGDVECNDNDEDGYTICNGDCDDNDPNINPGAIEICDNEIDDDCDGYIDEDCDPECIDNDGDGYGEGEGCFDSDCDDFNSAVNPGAIEICDNGIDDDCDGLIDEDCTPVEHELIAHYEFEDNFADSSGHGHNGTNNGANIVDGKIGQAADFSSGDHIDIGTFDVIGDQLTIAAWIKPDNMCSGGSSSCDARIISKADGVNEANHWWMLSGIKDQGSGETRLRFRLKTEQGGTETLKASQGHIATNTWTHVAAVYDGSSMILYKDGIEVGRTSKSGIISTNDTKKVHIGNNPVGSKPYDGLMDDVRVYNEALSAYKINELAQDDGVNDSPVAIAAALTPTTGEAPLVVEFSSQGSIDPEDVYNITYLWEASNGVSSNQPNPTYTFDQVGEYVVSLTVGDTQGLTATSEPITITVTESEPVNQPPVFILPRGDTNRDVDVGSQIVFLVRAFDPDGDAISYDVEEGELPEGAGFETFYNLFHVFAWTPTEDQVGQHTVTFIASDDEDNETSKLITITVIGEEPEETEDPDIEDIEKEGPIDSVDDEEEVYKIAPSAVEKKSIRTRPYRNFNKLRKPIIASDGEDATSEYTAIEVISEETKIESSELEEINEEGAIDSGDVQVKKQVFEDIVSQEGCYNCEPPECTQVPTSLNTIKRQQLKFNKLDKVDINSEYLDFESDPPENKIMIRRLFRK